MTQVFVSYAGVEGPLAEEFASVVKQHGVDVFTDKQIPLAENVVLEISDRLERADYYVLLWSRAAIAREWVRREWAAALAIEVERKRLFLYIVRLDETPLPAMLKASRYTDAFDSGSANLQRWKDAAEQLVEAWKQDQGFGAQVYPAPNLPGAEGEPWVKDGINILIRNRALRVGHRMLVSQETSAKQLYDCVRTQLKLPDKETTLGGALGLRFTYHLYGRSRQRIEAAEGTSLGLGDGEELDLQVLMEPFGLSGPPSEPIEFWHGSEPHSPDGKARLPMSVIRSLARSAFKHLAVETGGDHPG